MLQVDQDDSDSLSPDCVHTPGSESAVSGGWRRWSLSLTGSCLSAQKLNSLSAFLSSSRHAAAAAAAGRTHTWLVKSFRIR